jgi:Holliday junction resolvase RusA-like endonuclease
MLKGIVLIDDNLVTKIIAMKCYSVEPKTVMTISPYGG